MDAIEQLAALFERFPGVGPRQSRRFVQYLLRAPSSLRKELVQGVQGLGSAVRQCTECLRFHAGTNALCSICSQDTRDDHLLMVIASDPDLASVEQSAVYRGRYLVTGGLLSIGSQDAGLSRAKEMTRILEKKVKSGLSEIILALPANPEGDMTASYLERLFEPMIQGTDCTISMLGRGLSTGSELEYADPDTIKNALTNRH